MIKLLIVDDNKEHRDALAACAMIEGGETEVKIFMAGTLAEAVKLTVEIKPDLTFLDLYLPDASIDDVLRAIKNFTPPVIICSGMKMSHRRVGSEMAILGEVIVAGAEFYIEKGSVLFSEVYAIWMQIVMRKNKELASDGR
jgi:CheY-like chemotaxis protein